jgi:hypothetical protein
MTKQEFLSNLVIAEERDKTFIGDYHISPSNLLRKEYVYSKPHKFEIDDIISDGTFTYSVFAQNQRITENNDIKQSYMVKSVVNGVIQSNERLELEDFGCFE